MELYELHIFPDDNGLFCMFSDTINIDLLNFKKYVCIKQKWTFGLLNVFTCQWDKME